jgi:flagellar M-ring protein FliF
MDQAGAGSAIAGQAPHAGMAAFGAHLLQLLRVLGPSRILALGLVALTLLGFFTFVIFKAVEQPLELLFSNLEPADAQEIATRLATAGVAYRMAPDGRAVLVPADQVLQWRMSLAQEGLPTGGTVGDELFDRTSGLTTTDFLADVSVRRALEGELARTIASLRPVRAARVHIVEPKRALFRRDAEPASASILLSLSGGTLDKGQIAGIRHLVAGAVPGLAPDSVSVLDDRGNLLARPENGEAGSSLEELDDHRAAFEQRIREKLIQLLERSLGPGKAEVEVAADFDFDTIETTSETYDPEGQVPRSTQNVEETTSRTERQADGSVTVANNLPTERVNGEGSGRSQERLQRTEETSNFEISRTVKNQRKQAPSLRHLSIAVQVDGIYRSNSDGTSAFEPRSSDELTQLETLVRSAAGSARSAATSSRC